MRLSANYATFELVESTLYSQASIYVNHCLSIVDSYDNGHIFMHHINFSYFTSDNTSI